MAQAACPDLQVLERDEDRDAREFEPIVRAIADMAPRVEVVEPGWLCVAARGPARYFGGDHPLAAKIVSVATTQEEIGTRGAQTSAFAVDPHVALIVDVGHATDHPDCDQRKFGETKLGGGPIICRGPNINPKVYDRLVAVARKIKIPFQLEADPRPTGTDARAIQMARGGVACGLVSIPLRYMHTPSEVVDLQTGPWIEFEVPPAIEGRVTLDLTF